MTGPINSQLALREIIKDLRDVLDRLGALVIPETVKELPDDTKVNTLGLGVGISGRLEREGIFTLAQLAACTEPDLMDIPTIGSGKIAAIARTLALTGRCLADWEPGTREEKDRWSIL